jgi:hypothetical protein
MDNEGCVSILTLVYCYRVQYEIQPDTQETMSLMVLTLGLNLSIRRIFNVFQ